MYSAHHIQKSAAIYYGTYMSRYAERAPLAGRLSELADQGPDVLIELSYRTHAALFIIIRPYFSRSNGDARKISRERPTPYSVVRAWRIRLETRLEIYL